MKRPVIVMVDDGEKVVVYGEKGMKERKVPVPGDGQLTRHARNAVASLEAEASEERRLGLQYGEGSSYRKRHALRAEDAQASADRLRAAFQLDQN